MNAAMAIAVSWRSIDGPAWRIELGDYAESVVTAIRLRMDIDYEAGVAYLTDRTPDLAEAWLERRERTTNGTNGRAA